MESCGRDDDDDDDDDDLYALSRQSVARTSARARVRARMSRSPSRSWARSLALLALLPARLPPLRDWTTRRHVRGLVAVVPLPHERAMSVAIAGRRRRRARDPLVRALVQRTRMAAPFGPGSWPERFSVPEPGDDPVFGWTDAVVFSATVRIDPNRAELAPETPPPRRERHRARVRRVVRALSAPRIPLSRRHERATHPNLFHLLAPSPLRTRRYPDSFCCGAYHEAAIVLDVEHATSGASAMHCPWMLVDSDRSMIAGREVLGFRRNSATSRSESTARTSPTRRSTPPPRSARARVRQSDAWWCDVGRNVRYCIGHAVVGQQHDFPGSPQRFPQRANLASAASGTSRRARRRVPRQQTATVTVRLRRKRERGCHVANFGR